MELILDKSFQLPALDDDSRFIVIWGEKVNFHFGICKYFTEKTGSKCIAGKFVILPACMVKR